MLRIVLSLAVATLAASVIHAAFSGVTGAVTGALQSAQVGAPFHR
jgi:hypothetical protein